MTGIASGLTNGRPPISDLQFASISNHKSRRYHRSTKWETLLSCFLSDRFSSFASVSPSHSDDYFAYTSSLQVIRST